MLRTIPTEPQWYDVHQIEIVGIVSVSVTSRPGVYQINTLFFLQLRHRAVNNIPPLFIILHIFSREKISVF